MSEEKLEGSGEGFLGRRDSAQVRLYDVLFLCIFYHFYTWSHHQSLVKCPGKEHVPRGWGKEG